MEQKNTESIFFHQRVAGETMFLDVTAVGALGNFVLRIKKKKKTLDFHPIYFQIFLHFF